MFLLLRLDFASVLAIGTTGAERDDEAVRAEVELLAVLGADLLTRKPAEGRTAVEHAVTAVAFTSVEQGLSLGILVARHEEHDAASRDVLKAPAKTVLKVGTHCESVDSRREVKAKK